MAEDPAALSGLGYRQLTLAVIADANGWISSQALYPERKRYGLAHLSGPLRDLRRKYPHLAVLALGDWVQGAPAPNDPTAALLRIGQSLGFAAALPGETDLRRIASGGSPSTVEPALPWIASDLYPPLGAQAHIMAPIGGLRVGFMGLTRPGALAATHLARPGISVKPAERAGRSTLDALSVADVRIALVNGSWDGAENAATALVEGRPVRHGLHELTDGSIPVDLIIARGGGRRTQDGNRASASLNTTPTVVVTSGLSLIHVNLEAISGRWHVAGVATEWIAPAPEPDPEILALAGTAWSRMAAWLAAPTRAIVSGYNRKAEFTDCAGALSHDAVVASVTHQKSGMPSGTPVLSLTPQFWRFEPLRKRRRGEAITRGQLYRWMTHEEAMVPAHLTGRQITLLLEPYARSQSGWSVSPSLVLHPGGITPRIVGRATQPAGLSLADGGAMRDSQRYPVWLPAYHAEGPGGLARRALLNREQLGEPLALALREMVFQWMASPAFKIPAPCAGFLALAPHR